MEIMNEFSLTLKNAVNNLYKTFSRYRHKESGFCTHCVSVAENKRLDSKSLDRLSGEDLSRYASKALTTWGDAEDFKHFLPRIFELVALNDLGINSEIAFGKLEYANWQKWSAGERAAIENFFRELMRFSVELGGEDIYRASEFLSSIACAVDDVTFYLDLWLEPPTRNKILNLRYFVIENDYSSTNPFLGDKLEQRRQIVDWLTSKKNVERFENLFFEDNEFQNTAELAELIDALSAIE